MTIAADPDVPITPKASKKPLLIGFLLAIVGGVGGFFAVSLGVLPLGEKGADTHDVSAVDSHGEAMADLSDIAFVALDPLLISLPGAGGQRYLRFSAQLEVSTAYQVEVETMKPRVVDILNGYLRAVEVSEMEDPTALVRLRGQMLRRVQVVVGEGRVRDLLIMEFVIN